MKMLRGKIYVAECSILKYIVEVSEMLCIRKHSPHGDLFFRSLDDLGMLQA